ncbi:exopolysaccharide biosynthesis polyprenyl glycosylphosphotransferase [Microvirga sp. 2MCAF35]|uniref:exopolysaccharide biosynthesis polyprenyl glycosylphosphotransferase n=1 Tax=Microvirga sp. 2MCAF35 TaxID=3232987 RepID=UPI003F96F655
MTAPHQSTLMSGYAFDGSYVALSRAGRAQKRIFDIVLSCIVMVAVFPILVIIAVAIKLDTPGPVLFRQTRVGLNGRRFRIYKFRTMTVLEDGELIVQAKHFDPRITRVGRWLRRLSLDELPQLLNVLKGEMSLVGPRPHALAHDHAFAKLINSYAIRGHVRPGITGLAQVHGLRGETATIQAIQKRVELDVEYIARWSMLLDLEILVRTVGEIVRPRNAY